MISLNEEQRRAVDNYKTRGLTIVNGTPGSGKTTVIQQLVIEGEKTLYCAPTGGAKDRLCIRTKHEAYVIKKILYDENLLLEFRGANVIMDEGSLLNMMDFDMLLKCIQPRRLAILGDTGQLAPVDGIPALNTLCSTPSLAPFVIKLTSNHRQLNSESGLVKTLQTLGTDRFSAPFLDDSLRIVYCESSEIAIAKMAAQFTSDCQMLAMRGKDMDALNFLTRESGVNRVVCTDNFYAKVEGEKTMLVSNGTMGDLFENEIVYSNGFVDKKDPAFLSTFSDARCITVHKSQGNEFEEHGLFMVSGWHGPVPVELMYTALSRFKHKVTVFGTSRNIAAAFKGKFDKANIDREFISECERSSKKQRN